MRAAAVGGRPKEGGGLPSRIFIALARVKDSSCVTEIYECGSIASCL